ncbi:hypothetical protein EDF56_11525 [Novosphingobium sp. PhB165]|uniref:hypothetical protein n=1 Tax=Novosphingobium sp. PhB165 TaxID=2485105 RepID=UPI0010494F5B|nr:hypothetical protein [Novosphingobium sp. PhB165]TCM14000.1 hypothetical protein EDF56_11525 [Novosphingobium sp. PhB165]
MIEKDRFDVIAPSGQRRTIVEWQRYTELRPLSDPGQKVPDTEFFTDTGYDASENSDGTFTTFDSDEIFTRV